ncbi:MAG: hypothetical protein PVJ57_22265 [Phycisphaerae bacterium]|jgi:hypothetical protein
MIDSHGFKADADELGFYLDLRCTDNLPTAMQFWMAQAAQHLLRLGVYFRAAVLLYQLPGAAHFRFFAYDDNDPDLPNEDEDPSHWLGHAERNTVFNVLAECLRRLGAPGVMKQVPGGKCYHREELSAEWRAYLDRHARIKHGLLRVVAECLDELMVQPGLKEIDTEPRPTWWQHWWSQIE